MGRLGLRAGIKPELLTGIINTDYNSIGLEAESGIYINAYGFFFYEKLHKNNNKTTKSGALYYELGSYLDMALVAQAGKGKVKASKDLKIPRISYLTAIPRLTQSPLIPLK
jgi:hypothetical protein